MEYIVKCVPIDSSKDIFEIPFHEEVKEVSTLELAQTKETEVCIFSDCTYQFFLPEECAKECIDVIFYINGEKEKICFYDRKKRRISFALRSGVLKEIFTDCFGFVQLSIKILYPNGKSPTGTSELFLKSKQIPVMVKVSPLNQTVEAMAKYVFYHHDTLLDKGKQKPDKFSGTDEGKQQAMEAQIHLLEEIWKCYEDCFDYFRTNCRFKIEERNRVDSLEKLQVITSETMAFMACHPEYLKKTNSATGIFYGNQVYHPEKTLISEQYHCKNIHENQVVLFFLKTILIMLEESIETLEELKNTVEHGKSAQKEGYISSYLVMVGFAVESLGKSEAEMKSLYDLHEQFQTMLHSYSRILEFKVDDIHPLQGMPAPSAILLSVPQYNRIYVLIDKWLHFNKYEFLSEKYLLSIVEISDLYESYLLAKHIQYFLREGWEVEKQFHFHYVAKEEWKYHTTLCDNTFVFVKGTEKITMYHEPAINSDYKRPENNINLYKATSVSFSGTGSLNPDPTKKFSNYYAPDFIFKIEKNQEVRYIIGDAKFSEETTVLEKRFSQLVYKYLFSIVPNNKEEIASGLVVLYGKDVNSSGIKTVYDNESEENHVRPFAELVSLNESVAEESHFRTIKAYLEK